jgi:carboxymethylenebutenolidase
VAPVYGFYAGNDARIGATVPDTTSAMKAAGKVYEPVTYDGAGHGFMRAGEDPTNTNPANKTARDQGFARLVKLLHEMKPAQAASSSLPTRPISKDSARADKLCHEAVRTGSGS